MTKTRTPDQRPIETRTAISKKGLAAEAAELSLRLLRLARELEAAEKARQAA